MEKTRRFPLSIANFEDLWLPDYFFFLALSALNQEFEFAMQLLNK